MADFVGGPERARSKGLAIYEDMIYFLAHDGAIVALDAKTGKERWVNVVQNFKELAQATSSPIVVDGKVITNRTCETRADCFLSAHDAKTGKELWKFYNTPAEGEPGGDSWGKVPTEKRIASAWGLPGSYDPERKLLYWGISNPKPWTRWKRHGDINAVPREAPSELYSNSTVAVDIETGKLKWYYQHLPGDDWDLDHVHERTLVRTAINPDPAAVKWINPNIPRGEVRNVVVSVGEAGGIWVLDRATGQFIWATPFPLDVPEFHISKIDVDTGRTHINWDKVKKHDGDRILVCFHNTRSFWSTAYHPGKNALYIPHSDACLDMTENFKNPAGFGPRRQVMRPGSDPKKLVTAGDLVFWGDMDRRFRAFDADSGKIVWETILGGIIATSTITYSVNGRQYVAVLTGDAQSGTAGLLGVVKDIKPVRGHNAIYVFALPEKI
jgi:alcohol dehydrogenase (cytochrome c)